MNKLEKSKLQEIDQALYQLNAYISLNFIGRKLEPEYNDWIKINDEIARCIRQLRNLQ